MSHYAHPDSVVNRYGWTNAVCGERIKDRQHDNDPSCSRCAAWLKKQDDDLPAWARAGITQPKETPMTEPQKRAVLIDLSSVAYPIWKTAEKDVAGPGTTTNLVVQAVHEYSSGQPHTIICCDSRTNFRKDIDATYKANREEKEAAYYHELNQAKKRLIAEGYPVLESEGFEADDIIGTLTIQAVQAGFGVLIISADKDLMQLIDDAGDIQTKSPATGSFYNEAAVFEKFGVTPSQMVDYLSLLGDASDNIKGAEGIGKVTAGKILKTFGTVQDACEALDNGNPKAFTDGTRKSLTEFCSRRETVRSLIELRLDVPVTFDPTPRVSKQVESFRAEADEPKAMTFTPGQQEEAQVFQPAIVGQPTQAAEVVGAGESPLRKPAEEPQKVVEGAPVVKGAEERMRSTSSAPVAADQSLAVAQRDPAWLLAPRNLKEADNVALRLFDSGLFSAYGTPQAVLSTILFGQELGIPPMTALRSVHIVEGKHCMSAQLIMGLVLKSGFAKKFELVETTNEQCVYDVQRVGGKVNRFTYTMDDARRANLVKPKSGWEKNPRNMLMWRCVTEACRATFSDVVGGLYTAEEIRESRS